MEFQVVNSIFHCSLASILGIWSEKWWPILHIFDIATMYIRVSMVVTIHDNLLTLWRHILMGQFRANIFLTWTMYHFKLLMGLRSFKKFSFKSQLFWTSHRKNDLKLKSWVNFSCYYCFVLIRLKVYVNFQKIISPKMGLNSCSLIYKSILT